MIEGSNCRNGRARPFCKFAGADLLGGCWEGVGTGVPVLSVGRPRRGVGPRGATRGER